MTNQQSAYNSDYLESVVISGSGLIKQRTHNWQFLAYLILVFIILLISIIALVGVINNEYRIPLNPIISVIIWGVAIIGTFVGIYLLWNDTRDNVPLCSELAPFGHEMPYLYLCIISFLFLLGGAISYYYAHNHGYTVAFTALSFVSFLVLMLQSYHEDIRAGIALMLPMLVSAGILLNLVFNRG